jgi:hypothetical protein
VDHVVEEEGDEMSQALSQLSGIIQYEFRMQWRRRTVLVVMFPIALVPLLYAVFFKSAQLAPPAALTVEQLAQQESANATAFNWALEYIVLAFALPVAVAETLPKDRQLGVSETLGSLPLGPGVYLSGKLISVWLITLAGFLIAIVLNAIVWRVTVGPFELGPTLQVWLVGALSIALTNSALSVLIASQQPTRRRALFVAAVFVMACALMLITGLEQLRTLNGEVISFGQSLNLGRAALLLHYLFGLFGAWGNFSQSVQAVVPESAYLSILGGVLEVAALWIVMWLWMRWRKQ